MASKTRLSALFGAASLTLAASGAAAATNPDAIKGDWWTEERDAIVRIDERDGVFFGELLWTEEADAKDDENPAPELRTRPLRGLVFLKGFRFDDGEWSGGSVYAPDDGKTYSGYMKLDGPDTLKLRGYVGLRLFGRTATWSRVASDSYPEGVK